MLNLSHEGQAAANLLGGLVKLLGIERGSNAESYTGTEKDVVGDGGNTTVIDLSLSLVLTNMYCYELWSNIIITLANERVSSLYLVATSRPTELLVDLESQVALAPTSTCELALW